MDDELLKKAKSGHRRAILVVVVVALFAAAFFWGFKVMGPGKGGSDKSDSGKGAGGTVTVSIDCKSLAEDPSKLTKPELKKYMRVMRCAGHHQLSRFPRADEFCRLTGRPGTG